jgi:hypothetical protein
MLHRVNREILDFLNNLAIRQFDRLTLKVLPELLGPTLEETWDWVHSEEVGKFCDREALSAAARDYFASWSREHPRVTPTRIPMETLSRKLMDMMSRTQISQGAII